MLEAGTFQQPVPATAFGHFTGTALQEALDYMSRKGGGEVYLPSGSANILSATVTPPFKTSIVGGKGSTIAPGEEMSSLIRIEAGLTAIEGIKLENASGYADNAIEVDKSPDDFPIYIHNNYIASFTNALLLTNGDCLKFSDNMCNSNYRAVDIANDGRNSHFSNNYTLGGRAYRINRVTQGAEGIVIDGDKMLPGPAGGIPVVINAALDIVIANCVIDQVHADFGVLVDATTDTINNVKLIGNYIGRNASASGANYGLFVSKDARSVVSMGNTYSGWRQAGIYFSALSGAPGKDNKSINDTFFWVDRCLRDIQCDYQDGLLIDGTTFAASGASIVEGTDCFGRVVNCDFSDSVLPPITSNLKYGSQRAGMVLRTKGTATLAQSTKNATITHGLSYTPTRADINIQAAGNPVNAPGEFNADTLGPTTFRAKCRNDPGAGGAPIVWEADLTR